MPPRSANEGSSNEERSPDHLPPSITITTQTRKGEKQLSFRLLNAAEQQCLQELAGSDAHFMRFTLHKVRVFRLMIESLELPQVLSFEPKESIPSQGRLNNNPPRSIRQLWEDNFPGSILTINTPQLREAYYCHLSPAGYQPYEAFEEQQEGRVADSIRRDMLDCLTGMQDHLETALKGHLHAAQLRQQQERAVVVEEEPLRIPWTEAHIPALTAIEAVFEQQLEGDPAALKAFQRDLQIYDKDARLLEALLHALLEKTYPHNMRGVRRTKTIATPAFKDILLPAATELRQQTTRTTSVPKPGQKPKKVFLPRYDVTADIHRLLEALLARVQNIREKIAEAKKKAGAALENKGKQAIKIQEKLVRERAYLAMEQEEKGRTIALPRLSGWRLPTLPQLKSVCERVLNQAKVPALSNRTLLAQATPTLQIIALIKVLKGYGLHIDNLQALLPSEGSWERVRPEINLISSKAYRSNFYRDMCRARVGKKGVGISLPENDHLEQAFYSKGAIRRTKAYSVKGTLTEAQKTSLVAAHKRMEKINAAIRETLSQAQQAFQEALGHHLPFVSALPVAKHAHPVWEEAIAFEDSHPRIPFPHHSFVELPSIYSVYERLETLLQEKGLIETLSFLERYERDVEAHVQLLPGAEPAWADRAWPEDLRLLSTHHLKDYTSFCSGRDGEDDISLLASADLIEILCRGRTSHKRGQSLRYNDSVVAASEAGKAHWVALRIRMERMKQSFAELKQAVREVFERGEAFQLEKTG